MANKPLTDKHNEVLSVKQQGSALQIRYLFNGRIGRQHMDRGLRDNVGYLQHYCGINTTHMDMNINITWQWGDILFNEGGGGKLYYQWIIVSHTLLKFLYFFKTDLLGYWGY